MASALVSYPLRALRDLPRERRRRRRRHLLGGESPRSSPPSRCAVARRARCATARFDDGIPRGLAGTVPADGKAYHSEAGGRREEAPWTRRASAPTASTSSSSRTTPSTTSFVPRGVGLLQARRGRVTPRERPDPPEPAASRSTRAAASSRFGEATTAQGLFQICEVGWQLRGEAGAAQVDGAKVGLAADARPRRQRFSDHPQALIVSSAFFEAEECTRRFLRSCGRRSAGSADPRLRNAQGHHAQGRVADLTSPAERLPTPRTHRRSAI